MSQPLHSRRPIVMPRMHELLAPLRAHARRRPLERIAVDRDALLRNLVNALAGAPPEARRHAAHTVRALAPKLYDLWSPARAYRSGPAWLAPLTRYLSEDGVT